MNNSQIGYLQKIVGRQNMCKTKEELLVYEYDATLLKGAPEVIIFPETTRQVSEILAFSYQEGIPVNTRGAGTNLSGGTIPDQGGIALVMTKMNKILEMNLSDQYVVVEPGVINQELQDLLLPYGYYYPPDPASMKACTIGGNIGECSGGPRCLKYGVTRDYVLGMEIVLSTGEIVEVGSKDQVYNEDLEICKLMTGSEGTLGVFTKIYLKIKKMPEASKTMLCTFNGVKDASKTVANIVSAGIVPTTLELMDNLLINCAEDFTGLGLDREAAALLLIEVDGFKEELDRQALVIQQICERNKVKEFKIAQSRTEVDRLWTARRTVIGAVARKRPSYSLQDVTVPRNKLPDIVEEIVSISEEYQLPIGVLAHAGDGNLHPLVLFDERDEEEVKKVHEAEYKICKAALALGGTLSGEHGIGLLKRPFLAQEFSPEVLKLKKQIMLAFDPQNILNPDKILEVGKQ
ncbi:MAG: FAD-binding oxidoreductase [Peptococcaceae bacterium]